MRSIGTRLAAVLSPEMYRVAVEASNKELANEIMKMAFMLMIDEMGKELMARGCSDADVHEVIQRGCDRASMAGDIILMQSVQGNVGITPSDLLDLG